VDCAYAVPEKRQVLRFGGLKFERVLIGVTVVIFRPRKKQRNP
jgi:hypothetical protein